MQGHVSITVGGVTYPLIIDPPSYSEVDIVDFAPRVLSGTPAWSEQGIYLDFGQDDYKHGFGAYHQKDAAMYAYSDGEIDTRHGPLQLAAKATAVWSNQSYTLRDLLVISNDWYDQVLACGDTLYIKQPVSGTWVVYTDPAAEEFRRMNDNGKYVFVSSSGTLRIVWFGKPSAGVNATSATFPADTGFEDTNMWADNGYAYIVEGTGAGNRTAITASNATSITVAAWTGTQPTTGSYIMLIADCANANEPNNYLELATSGGYFWGSERLTHYAHFWSEITGSDAEGSGTTDTEVVEVGPQGGKIVKMMPYNNQLWVFRYDGAWTVSDMASDNLAYHALDFTAQVDSGNFADVIVWDGFLIFPIRNTIYKYKTGLQDISPPKFDEETSCKGFGNFQGLVARGDWLYTLGQANAASPYAHTDESAAGFVSLLATNGVGWHKLWTIPVANLDTYRIWLDQQNDVLYIYVETTGNKSYLYTVPLQAYTDYPYPSYTTDTYASLYTSWLDFGLKRIQKSFASVTVFGTISAAQDVRVQYRTAKAGAWTTLGTFDADGEEIDFPAGVNATKIQLRVQLRTSQAAASPIVDAVVLKFMMRPDVLYGVNCDVIVASDVRDAQRKQTGLTAAETRTALKAGRASVSPITFIDITGTSASAYLASLRFILMEYEDTNKWEMIGRCTFVYV